MLESSCYFPLQSNNHPVVRFLLVLKTRSNHQPVTSKSMSQIRAMVITEWMVISNYLGKVRMMQAQIRPPGLFFCQTLASSGVAVLIRLHTALKSQRECPKASCCFLYIVIVIIFNRVDNIQENWVFLRYPRSNNHPIV